MKKGHKKKQFGAEFHLSFLSSAVVPPSSGHLLVLSLFNCFSILHLLSNGWVSGGGYSPSGTHLCHNVGSVREMVWAVWTLLLSASSPHIAPQCGHVITRLWLLTGSCDRQTRSDNAIKLPNYAPLFSVDEDTSVSVTSLAKLLHTLLARNGYIHISDLGLCSQVWRNFNLVWSR